MTAEEGILRKTERAMMRKKRDVKLAGGQKGHTCAYGNIGSEKNLWKW